MKQPITPSCGSNAGSHQAIEKEVAPAAPAATSELTCARSRRSALVLLDRDDPEVDLVTQRLGEVAVYPVLDEVGVRVPVDRCDRHLVAGDLLGLGVQVPTSRIVCGHQGIIQSLVVRGATPTGVVVAAVRAEQVEEVVRVREVGDPTHAVDHDVRVVLYEVKVLLPLHVLDGRVHADGLPHTLHGRGDGRVTFAGVVVD